MKYILYIIAFVCISGTVIYQGVRHDTTMTGDGITGSELKADTTILSTKANVLVVSAGKVSATGSLTETITGVKTFSADPLIPDEAYDATAWNGVLEPPTKNAVRDKIETLGGGTKPPIIFTWDGMGATVITGSPTYFVIPYSCTIAGWSIVAIGSSPTTTIDVWRVAAGTALPTVANTIMGTKPALSSGNVVRSSTLTGWSPTTVTAGEIWAANLDAVSAATWIRFTIEVN